MLGTVTDSERSAPVHRFPATNRAVSLGTTICSSIRAKRRDEQYNGDKRRDEQYNGDKELTFHVVLPHLSQVTAKQASTGTACVANIVLDMNAVSNVVNKRVVSVMSPIARGAN